MLPVAPCLRPRALPCAGRAPHAPSHHGKGDTGLRRCRVTAHVGANTTRDLKPLADLKVRREVRRATISWRGSSSLFPNTSSGDRACGLTEGVFSTTVPAGRVGADDSRIVDPLRCPPKRVNYRREGADWNAPPVPVAARRHSGFDLYRRRPRDRPEGGGVSTSRDRNRGSPAAVREPLPAGDRVPTPLDGRARGRCRGADQTRVRTSDR